MSGFTNQIKLNSMKPCRSSYIEGSLVTGRAPSSVSVPVPQIGGNGSSFVDYELSEADPEVREIINKEKERQFKSLELIASENFTSRAVMEAVGSCLTKKYSKDCPVKDIMVSLDLPHGGHLSHGFMTPKRRVSDTSIYFESMPYRPDESAGLVDYDMLEKTAILFRPKLIIAGASAYPRDFDYPCMRKIADAVGAFLMMDMAHISGLVAASVVANPFEYCDIVTTTTYKSLRGPRGGMIFFQKGSNPWS